MDSYGSVSFRKYTSWAILLVVGTALTLAVYSTTAMATMFYSGHEGARERVVQVWDRCNRLSDRGDRDAFARCIDRHLKGIKGLYFAVLVAGGGSAGYSWNYRSLTDALDRATLECRKNTRKRCGLYAFAINGCIAYGKGSDYHGYGVGPTKTVAKQRMLGLVGNDVRSCSPDCEVKQVYCAG